MTNFVDRIVEKLGDAPADRFRVGFCREYFPKALNQLDEYLEKGWVI